MAEEALLLAELDVGDVAVAGEAQRVGDLALLPRREQNVAGNAHHERRGVPQRREPAYQVLRRIKGEAPVTFPVETAMGALVNYIMTVEKPCPSNINFGLLPTVELTKEQRKGDRKRIKKELVSRRAQEVFQNFYSATIVSTLN